MIVIKLRSVKPIPVAIRSKAWVSGSSLVGNAGLNLRSAWYTVIHDLLPTNTRLQRIRLVDTDNGAQCGKQDTTLHQLTECRLGRETWEWTRTRIAWIHRTDPRRVPTEWFLRPCFQLWPRHKKQATLWILANMVFYLVHTNAERSRYWTICRARSSQLKCRRSLNLGY